MNFFSTLFLFCASNKILCYAEILERLKPFQNLNSNCKKIQLTPLITSLPPEHPPPPPEPTPHPHLNPPIQLNPNARGGNVE